VARGIHEPKFYFGGRWKDAEIVSVVPIIARSNGARAKSAAAVGTYVLQQVLYTGTAEGAFETADHCVCGIRRKGSITILAGWSQFQHRLLFVEGGPGMARAAVVPGVCLSRFEELIF